MPRTTFSPQQHGFHFKNGWEPLTVNIPGYGQATINGRCSGMVFAALDYYFAGIPIPTHRTEDFAGTGVPPEGGRLSRYIKQRAQHASASPSAYQFIHWTASSDDDIPPYKGVSTVTREFEFEALRQSIDSGQPVALGLVRATQLESLVENLLVVAYGYDVEPSSKEFVLYLYDPGRPDQEITLSSASRFLASTGEQWRGFFVHGYTPVHPPYVDLVASGSLRADVTPLLPGDPLLCEFTVKNCGDYPAHLAAMRLSLRGPSDENLDHLLGADQELPPLPPGEERTLRRRVEALNLPPGAYRLSGAIQAPQGHWQSRLPPAPAPYQSKNLMTNPVPAQLAPTLPRNLFVPSQSFEADLADWTTHGGGTIERTALANAFDGKYVMKVIALPSQPWSGAVSIQNTPLKPNTTYTFVTRIYIPTDVQLNGTWEFHRQSFGDAGGLHKYDILASDHVWNDSSPKGVWLRKWTVIKTHQDANPKARLFVCSQDRSGASGYVYADGFEILEGDHRNTTSFSGDLDGGWALNWTRSNPLATTIDGARIRHVASATDRDARAESARFAIDTTRNITCSAYAEVEAVTKGSFVIYIDFWDAAGNRIQRDDQIIRLQAVTPMQRYSRSYGPTMSNAWPEKAVQCSLRAMWQSDAGDAEGIAYSCRYQAEYGDAVTPFEDLPAPWAPESGTLRGEAPHVKWERRRGNERDAVSPPAGAHGLSRIAITTADGSVAHQTNEAIGIKSGLHIKVTEDTYLEYWIQIPDTTNLRFSVQLRTDSGLTREANLNDQNGVSANWNTDLLPHALGRWYFRRISLAPLAGQSVSELFYAAGDDPVEARDATYNAWFAGIRIVTLAKDWAEMSPPIYPRPLERLIEVQSPSGEKNLIENSMLSLFSTVNAPNLFVPARTFEVDTRDWAANSGGSFERASPPINFTSNYALKVTAVRQQHWSGASSAQNTPLKPNTLYTFAARIFIPRDVTLGGDWEFHRHAFGDSGQPHNYDMVASDHVWNDSSPKGAWIRKWTVIKTRAENNIKARLFVTSRGGSGAGGYVYADGFEIIEGDHRNATAFSSAARDERWPQGWHHTSNPAEPATAISGEAKVAGAASVLVEGSRFKHVASGTDRQAAVESNTVRVDRSRALSFSAYSEVTLHTKGSFCLSVRLLDAAGKEILQHTFATIERPTGLCRYGCSFGPGTPNPWPEGTAECRMRGAWQSASGDAEGTAYSLGYQAELGTQTTSLEGSLSFNTDEAAGVQRGEGHNVSWLRERLQPGGEIALPLGVKGLTRISVTTKGGNTAHSTNDEIKLQSGLAVLITPNTHLEYWIFIPQPTTMRFSIQFRTGDGKGRWGKEEANEALKDQNGLPAHWATDLTARALGTWYFRRISLAALAGQTIQEIIYMTGDDPIEANDATYTAFFAGVRLVYLGRMVQQGGWSEPTLLPPSPEKPLVAPPILTAAPAVQPAPAPVAPATKQPVWRSLGGTSAGALSAISAVPSQIDLYYRGANNQAYQRSGKDGQWPPESALGGQFISDLFAVALDKGSRLLLGVGLDKALWCNRFDGQWSGWQSLGGIVTATPSACVGQPGEASIIVRTAENGLAVRRFLKDGRATDWMPIPGNEGKITSAPCAVAVSPDQVQIFYRGPNGALWQTFVELARGGQVVNQQTWPLDGTLAGAPTALYNPAENLYELFVRGTDNALWYKRWKGQWSNWESLGGELQSDPVAVSTAPDRIDLFARGRDGALWQTWRQGNAWNTEVVPVTVEVTPAKPTLKPVKVRWESLGGVLVGGPDVTARIPGSLDLAVRGTDNALYHKAWSEGGSWSNWNRIPSVLTADPAIISWGKQILHSFHRGTDNGLYHNAWQEGKGWSPWNRLEGNIQSSPAASSLAPGHLDIFWRGADNALWHKWFINNAWSNAERLGGTLSSDPTAVAWKDQVNVFVRGGDGALYWKFWTPQKGWEIDKPYIKLGETPASGPAACSWAPGRIDLFFRGADNALWHKWLEGDAWSAAACLGGELTSDPTVASLAPGRIDLFARGKAGDCIHTWCVDYKWIE